MGRYRSLEDFFLAGRPTIEGRLNDGWAETPLIGREIEATVLVARPRRVPGRAAGLGAAETLALLNKFFSWVADEPLRQSAAIVAGCGGGRLTAVFSREFADADPFDEALWVGRLIAEEDLEFSPRIGLAHGELIVGYLGTPLNYGCAAVGRPVDLAGVCADFEPPPGHPGAEGVSITFPREDWGRRDPEVVFAPRRWRARDGSEGEWRFPWRLLAATELDVPESSPLLVRRAVAEPPGLGPDPLAATPEEQVRDAVAHMRPAEP
ncbi:MAG: hypothetical protein QM729_07335 [Solirubrobacterales bacterium]